MHTVFATDGGESRALGHAHDVRQGHIDAARRPHLRAFKKIGRKLTCRKLNPDSSRTRTIRIGRGLNPTQAIPQCPSQSVNGEAKVLTLRRELKNDFLFVICQIVLKRGDFAKLREPRLQAFGCGLQGLGTRAINLDVEGVTTWPAAPASKADSFGKGVVHNLVLKFGDKSVA